MQPMRCIETRRTGRKESRLRKADCARDRMENLAAELRALSIYSFPTERP